MLCVAQKLLDQHINGGRYEGTIKAIKLILCSFMVCSGVLHLELEDNKLAKY